MVREAPHYWSEDLLPLLIAGALGIAVQEQEDTSG
jgi:hypothetical protein